MGLTGLSESTRAALAGLKTPALVLSDVPLGLDLPDVHEARPSDSLTPPYKTVLLVASDPVELRLQVSRLPQLGWARMVGVVVEYADRTLVPAPAPGWPEVWRLDAGVVDGVATTVLRFASRLDAEGVLLALARTAGSPAPRGNDGVYVARAGGLPVDPTAVETYAPDAVTPASFVVRGHGDGELETSPVLAHAPVAVAEFDPIDEGLFNPIGFRADWTRGVVPLPDAPLTPLLIAELRDAQAVETPADRRLCAVLSMAGVPLADAPFLDDPAAREDQSIRARREAMLEWSTAAWRARLAGREWPTLFDHLEVTGDPNPEQLTDLLLARHYSGADVVVLPTDGGPTECYGTGDGPSIRRRIPRSGTSYRAHAADRGTARG